MAFSAIMLFPHPSGDSGKYWPQGESGSIMGGIELQDDWSFSLENLTNIGSQTSGASSGKATFEAFTIKKQVDSSSATLFQACGAGASFMGVTVSLYKSGGEGAIFKENLFIQWTFNLLQVEKIEWSHDDVAPRENLTFKFGSCGIMYGRQVENNKIMLINQSAWNQRGNNNMLHDGISIPGSMPQIWPS